MRGMCGGGGGGGGGGGAIDGAGGGAGIHCGNALDAFPSTSMQTSACVVFLATSSAAPWAN